MELRLLVVCITCVCQTCSKGTLTDNCLREMSVTLDIDLSCNNAIYYIDCCELQKFPS